jgi:divalent metal cation (Fe/Co/Zn/Cd) transporter
MSSGTPVVGVIDEIRHAAEHVAGMKIVEAKARWIGHKLQADVAIAIDDTLPLSAANKIAVSLESELFQHLPALATANIRFASAGAHSAA